MKTWEKNIRRVEPYVPGEQPKVKDVVKLNTNENPYPPTPKVHEAAERMNISDLRLYPDPEVTDLVHAIAAYYGMNDNQVFVGVGSDDVLSMCFLTLIQTSQYCFLISHILSTVYGLTFTEFHMRSSRLIRILI